MQPDEREYRKYSREDYAPVHSKYQRARKFKKRRTIISTVLLVASIILFTVALGGLGFVGWQYWQGDQEYRSLSQYSSSKNVSDSALGAEDWELTVDWAALRAINPDIVAWVKIPGTNIDYPVAQGDDNDYYLTQTFDGMGNRYGCIFLDFESASDFTDYHSIIYGHNMRNGSMFHDLIDYINPDYLAEHPYILLGIPSGKTLRLRVVSAYVTPGDLSLRQIVYASDESFHAYLNDVAGESAVTVTGVDLAAVKHLYTFATCSYQFDDARTIVQAVEVDNRDNVVNTTKDGSKD